jgi:iron complex outermembrane receptor protein
MSQRSRAAVLLLSSSFVLPPPSAAASLAAPSLGHSRLSDPASAAVSGAGRAAASVRVITPQEMRESGARTVGELLAREAGVNAFDQVGNAFQPTVDLRGWAGSPVPAAAVFLDGVRVNEADFGQVNWQLLPLEDLERVEIRPGPGGAAFGRGALGGVILLSSRRAAEGAAPGAEAGASYGSFHRQKSWTGVDGTARGFDWRLFASRDLDGGWRDHSRSSADTLRGRLGWRDEESDVSVALQHTDDTLRQGGSVTGAELAADRRRNVSRVDSTSNLNAATLSLRRALPHGLSLAGTAYWRARRESTPENRGRSSVSTSRSDMSQRGAVAQLTWPFSLLGRDGAVEGGVEGGRAEASAGSSGDFGGFAFNSGTLHKDDLFAAFAQATVELLPERLTLSAALRRDESRQHYEDRVTPANGGRADYGRSSPRAGLTWTPREGSALYASYAEAFRAPTALELTAVGPFGGVPLSPVKEKAWEAGARLDGESGLRLRAAAFRADVTDEIYFDPTAGSFGQNINVPRTRRSGVETSAFVPLGRFEASAGYAWTRATFQSALTLSKAPFTNQQVRSGDAMPMVPEHRGTLELALRPTARSRVSVGGLCAGAQPLLGDEGNDEPALPGYCSLDAGASYETEEGWRFSLRGTNLTDARYQTRGILAALGARAERFYVPAPGAGVQATLSWRWGAAREKEEKTVASR